MKGLIQRVQHASVVVDNETVGKIENGILLFLGIEKEDTPEKVEKLLDKVLKYRIFSDEAGKMNRSLQDIDGGLLVVSQFTLVAETKKGLRPSFSKGADPEQGQILYNYFVEQAQYLHAKVATGRFGADMKITLLNDGPVTFLMEV